MARATDIFANSPDQDNGNAWDWIESYFNVARVFSDMSAEQMAVAVLRLQASDNISPEWVTAEFEELAASLSHMAAMVEGAHKRLSDAI